MSAVMNDVSKHWNMPWHAWLKSLAQTSKVVGTPSFTAVSDGGFVQAAPGLGGSWLIRARGRAAPMAASSL